MADFNSWVAAFGKEFPQLFGWFLLAWGITFVALVVLINVFRRQLRRAIGDFDGKVRRAAYRWRYRGTPSAAEQVVERILLTWFFRFWTNFASAPSLSFFSFAVPIVIYMNAPESPALFRGTGIWLLPGVCYGGSMLLSFWLKRVFKRVRPAREKGAFGHKLRDHSFPSGHSLTSFCFWVMMAACLALYPLSAWIIGIFSLVAVIIVLLTGISRIYLAVHWPSDVVGGFCIGAVWTVVCYAFLLRHVAGI